MPIISQGNTPIQINPIDADPNVAVGVGLPLDAANGAALSSTYTTKDQIRSNIKNLLATIPGERINEPEFGSRLWEYLFDPNTDDGMRKDRIDIEIKRSLGIYIPEVEVLGTKMAEKGSDEYNREIDMNKAGIIVYYRIIGTPIEDSISITTTV